MFEVEFVREDGSFDEEAWIAAWPDYPCPNCGTGGVSLDVRCTNCGCSGIIPLD